jgi:hypothetical protein
VHVADADANGLAGDSYTHGYIFAYRYTYSAA